MAYMVLALDRQLQIRTLLRFLNSFVFLQHLRYPFSGLPLILYYPDNYCLF